MKKGKIDEHLQKVHQTFPNKICTVYLEAGLEEVDDGPCAADHPDPHLGRLYVKVQLRGRVESPPGGFRF